MKRPRTRKISSWTRERTEQMKKGQVYEATVERVDFPNKGIAGVGEDTVIVKNSLPGQKVKFQVNKVQNCLMLMRFWGEFLCPEVRRRQIGRAHV